MKQVAFAKFYGPNDLPSYDGDKIIVIARAIGQCMICLRHKGKWSFYDVKKDEFVYPRAANDKEFQTKLDVVWAPYSDIFAAAAE